MKLKDIVRQLANRINQPHVVEVYLRQVYAKGFLEGAKQSSWIRVEERLPDEGQRVLVGFLYYYKYDNREAESRKHIDIFTYENGVWTTDCDISYLGRNVQKDDIKVVCWMPIPSFDEILKSNRDIVNKI
ncbi:MULTISPECIES: DUF551 domain-containing protein [Bacteroidales]|uniref:DUF551 domain-containing protein n=4 Tax=Bacteroidales TaxID=171549 RepID=A0A7J5QGS7_9BACE|nr:MULTISPECIES: DUF551 domain-containing protein [Bacteroidales]KAB6158314.1 DUF551 domain-containing protein [Bacteroides xylanisolvens]KAB6171147.1 DUF551 domain-containing protein [Bacteroides xylanisolvens]KAB6171942.1 DUF551 domain-containing protein [Bacteroides xylanisolvens]KAB6184235.1 DUF551 domain-containing protein [Bacteroides xylanisolvens]KAB6191065.1 DUF551 domain-containing protein [Bacteroides xylanisolvens]